MTKFSGLLGVDAGMVEELAGVFENLIVEYPISGELVYGQGNWSSDILQHSTFTLNHRFSFIAPKEAIKDMSSLLYLTWQGRKWKISSVTYESPRIKITVGGLYE